MIRDLMLKLRDPRGSEIVSVGLIMGLIAIVVLLIFVGPGGHGGLMDALEGLGSKVKSIIDGVTNTAT